MRLTWIGHSTVVIELDGVRLVTDPVLRDRMSLVLRRVGGYNINITGNISHVVSFRITPDVTRESGLVSLGPGSSVSNDSLVFRIKYAFARENAVGDHQNLPRPALPRQGGGPPCHFECLGCRLRHH